MAFLEKLRAQLNRLPRLRRFELFAAFVGLIADLIVLSSYVGIAVKPPAPPGTPSRHPQGAVPVASGDALSSLSTEMKCPPME
jgi:hypothetical protein